MGESSSEESSITTRCFFIGGGVSSVSLSLGAIDSGAVRFSQARDARISLIIYKGGKVVEGIIITMLAGTLEGALEEVSS